MEVIKDEQLWKIAERRAKFKRHLASYLIINGFLWALWYITAGQYTKPENILAEVPWPIWPTLGWGIGLAFSYAHAYHGVGGKDDVQKEYDKLLNQRKSN